MDRCGDGVREVHALARAAHVAMRLASIDGPCAPYLGRVHAERLVDALGLGSEGPARPAMSSCGAAKDAEGRANSPVRGAARRAHRRQAPDWRRDPRAHQDVPRPPWRTLWSAIARSPLAPVRRPSLEGLPGRAPLQGDGRHPSHCVPQGRPRPFARVPQADSAGRGAERP